MRVHKTPWWERGPGPGPGATPRHRIRPRTGGPRVISSPSHPSCNARLASSPPQSHPPELPTRSRARSKATRPSPRPRPRPHPLPIIDPRRRGPRHTVPFPEPEPLFRGLLIPVLHSVPLLVSIRNDAPWPAPRHQQHQPAAKVVSNRHARPAPSTTPQTSSRAPARLGPGQRRRCQPLEWGRPLR